MYLQLCEYFPYYNIQSEIFDQKINKNLRYCHGYTNYVVKNVLITWVSKNSWEIFCSEFPQPHVINPCTRTTIFNHREQIYVSNDIFYAGGNVEEKEDFGFSGSFFKKPLIIDDGFKNQ